MVRNMIEIATHFGNEIDFRDNTVSGDKRIINRNLNFNYTFNTIAYFLTKRS